MELIEIYVCFAPRRRTFKLERSKTEQTVTRMTLWAARKDLFAEKITARNSMLGDTARVSCPQRTAAVCQHIMHGALCMVHCVRMNGFQEYLSVTYNHIVLLVI